MNQHPSATTNDGRPGEAIRQVVGPLTRDCLAMTPATAPATDDDALAREIVAKIEAEDGYFACAAHRRNGAYDGDPEHRIALSAIQATRASISTGDAL